MRSTGARVSSAAATARRSTRRIASSSWWWSSSSSSSSSPLLQPRQPLHLHLHLHVQQRRAFWPFSRTRQKRPPPPSASATAEDSPSSSSVILPPSSGRALRALGPDLDRHDRLGIGFSAGGLLFPYYVGVAYALKDAGALVPGVTPLAGASAGSLIAACVGTGLGKEEVEVRLLREEKREIFFSSFLLFFFCFLLLFLSFSFLLSLTPSLFPPQTNPPPLYFFFQAACLPLADDCRTGGTFGRLGHVLRDFLEENLPKDAHEMARGKVHVAVTPLAAAEVAAVAPTREARISSEKLLNSLAEQAAAAKSSEANLLKRSNSSPSFLNPFALSPRALLVSDFTSREDLIEALLSSCHIPFWMTGKPTTRFRGGRAVDGGLLNFLPLPPPPGGPERGTQTGGKEEDLENYHSIGVCCFPSAATIGARLGPGRLIAPDVFEPLSALESAGFASSSSSSSSSASGSFDDGAESLQSPPPPLAPNFPTLLGWAFSPTSEENLLALAALGDADARAWARVELGDAAGKKKTKVEEEEKKVEEKN